MARSAAEQLGTPCDPSAGDECTGAVHRWPTALTYCTTPGCDYTIRGYWGDTITHHDDDTHTVTAFDPEETRP